MVGRGLENRRRSNARGSDSLTLRHFGGEPDIGSLGLFAKQVAVRSAGSIPAASDFLIKTLTNESK